VTRDVLYCNVRGGFYDHAAVRAAIFKFELDLDARLADGWRIIPPTDVLLFNKGKEWFKIGSTCIDSVSDGGYVDRLYVCLEKSK
jgi:hypothetical protein